MASESADQMTVELNKRDRMLFGLVLPVIILCLGLVIIMALPSGAAAAEFASLGVMLISIIFSPIILAATAALAWTAKGSRASCFFRGMIAPAIVLVVALSYQLGYLDNLI